MRRSAAAVGAVATLLLGSVALARVDDGDNRQNGPAGAASTAGRGARDGGPVGRGAVAGPAAAVDEPSGDGSVARTLLTYDDLMTEQSPPEPVAEAAFAMPAGAAMPAHTFEGRLTVHDTATGGSFRPVETGCPYVRYCGEHLPPVDLELVQHGSHLVPAVQGVVITGDVQASYRTYNLIVGPGRAWSEVGDRGPAGTFSRASLPFALVERNQNCTHNGVLTFLYDDERVSNVRFQVTAETCQVDKFDLWGQLPATYEPGDVAGADDIRRAHADELARRLPTRPLSALAQDHPDAGIDLAAFGAGISGMSAYGVVYDGVNYVADATSPNPGCQTRYGTYPYCSEMRLPSYSTAKTAFAGLAMALLVRLHGPQVRDELLRSHIPEAALTPFWATSPATFDDAADMATGHYLDGGFEADEAGPTMTAFLEVEPYEAKLLAALGYPNRPGETGTTWTYHTSDTFLLVQAATGYLRHHDPEADLFELVGEEVYEPIGLSAGALTTLRTDNLDAERRVPAGGRPLGGLGLFFTVDDVARLAELYQHNGEYDGEQLLDRQEVLAAMQRSAVDAGVAAVTSDASGTGDGTVAAGGSRYSNGMWAYPMTERVPGCTMRVPYMSGYGGITVAMFPNGASYYYFSDDGDFAWADVAVELDKLAPMCAGTTTTVVSDSPRQQQGTPVTFTATVASTGRSWAPTGTVQFEADGVSIGLPVPLTADGTAAFTTADLGPGDHAITARYLPDVTANTGIGASPARTTLAAPCRVGATTCAVTTTAGLHVGDTIVMGTAGGTADSHVVAALTPTSITWTAATQRSDHPAGTAVWVQNTAGGGFSPSSSVAVRQTIT